MRNPFEFGRELGPSELVDRVDEVRRVAEAMGSSARLFVIGPRRYGKTSILRVAAERAESEGAVVLRFNAEAYPSLTRMGQAIVAEAATRLTPSTRRAGQKVQAFFGALRPQLSFNPMDQSYSVGLTADPQQSEGALLTDVLGGVDRMAADVGRPVALVIDEFQQVVERGGVAAEGQVRAAVQRHEHLAYVFAGSKTRLLSEMTGDADRPFYRLGERLFVGPVPRADFAPFLIRGFAQADIELSEEAASALLDESANVPYNVQRLAHACWTHAREAGLPSVSPADVHEVLERVVRRDDPFYTQTWNRLTRAQQQALSAVAKGEAELFGKSTLKRYGLALSTMRSALEALVRTSVLRQQEQRGHLDYVLEDPFLGAWVRLFVPRS